ncbi:hypothetical protein [Bacillus sp. ISL-45]|nr:hypothetical protein [Bacillus sp. ISL-45]MBT2661911.1 hypothetical protein [Bacillus sp. ISL-45]
MKKDFQPVVITPEKAERIKTVVERILSRHTGKQIKIILKHESKSDRKAI